MTTETLSRVDWQLGQTLLPDHFIAGEESLLADVKARFNLMGLPYHGVGKLKINESLLAEGVLSIQNATIVMYNGQVVDVPGNGVADTFNMNVVGQTKVPVYLHLTSERAASTEADARAKVVGDGERLDRIVYRIGVSSEQTFKNAIQTLKLAVYEKSFQGEWKLADDYIPPLLQVGTSPFLGGLVDRIDKLLELFHFKLQEDIAASYLGGEGLFGAKLCLDGVYRLQRFFANLKGEVKLHPYFFYEALKQFYVTLCLFQNATPENVASTYQHDDLSASIHKVADPLVRQLSTSRGKTPYLTFEKKEGMFLISDIPGEVRQARELYFLIQKPRISDQVPMTGVKLASKSRLPVVHQLSLQGIPFTKIERPPFQHQFGSEVEFYMLREGEEWDQALREGTIAFFDQPAVTKVKAFIYWRA